MNSYFPVLPLDRDASTSKFCSTSLERGYSYYYYFHAVNKNNFKSLSTKVLVNFYSNWSTCRLNWWTMLKAVVQKPKYFFSIFLKWSFQLCNNNLELFFSHFWWSENHRNVTHKTQRTHFSFIIIAFTGFILFKSKLAFLWKSNFTPRERERAEKKLNRRDRRRIAAC